MTEYEFHVSGVIGPVVESALPELSADIDGRHSLLRGTAQSADDVQGVLHWLAEHGLEATQITITDGNRWQ